MGRGGEEMQGPSSVRMTSPSVLALGIVLSLIPGWVWSDITRGTRGVEVVHQLAHESAHHLHRRMKRGWIWKQLFVPEEDPTPRVIGQLKSDYDQDEFTIKYILSGEGAGDVFEIDEYSGEIRTLARLDREAKAFYVLQAQAINRRSSEPVEPQSEFIIKVQDINDNVPVFQNEPYVSSVPEMCPIGTTVAQVTATDADDPLFGNNAKLIYSILQGEPYFSVEPKTGMVVTSWPNMDREAREEYLVVVQVKDMLGLSGGYSASTTVTVSLTDVNDNGPTFKHNLYSFAVSEAAPVGTTVGRIMADDGDVGINARMSYTLEDLEESATFTIHTDPATQEGVVVLAKPLDYESKRRFVMAAEAVNDHVDPRFLSDMADLRDRCTLRVVVADVDEPPVFLAAAPYEWKVPENAAAGTVVGTVSARDTDSVNNPVRYAIDRSSDVRKAFKIDPNNGTLTLAKPLDRETANWHNLTVSATETKQARLSSSVLVFIKVLDINDNVPRLARDYQPYICEGTQAGEVIQLLSAVDPDDPVEGHHFYFSMVPERHINPNFTIRDNQDNTAGVVARRSTFTRKDRTQYLLPVVVSDSGSPALSSTSTLLVSVCSCQPAGHCPTGAGGGGVEALALSMGVSLPTLLALLVCLATLTGLSVLTLMLWSRRRRRRRKQQQQQQEAGEVEGDLELPDRFSQKVLRYGEPPGGCRGVGVGAGAVVGQPVPLRRPHPHHHPRRREQRRLRRADVAASVRMSSLRQSHLIGPEDDVFRQFIVDRLAEADVDPGAPPFDCPRSYAYEGSGATPAGSLSSLESCTWSTTVDVTAAVPERPPPPCINVPNPPPPPPGPPPPPPRPFLVRLTPWYGAGEEETIF